MGEACGTKCDIETKCKAEFLWGNLKGDRDLCVRELIP